MMYSFDSAAGKNTVMRMTENNNYKVEACNGIKLLSYWDASCASVTTATTFLVTTFQVLVKRDMSLFPRAI